VSERTGGHASDGIPTFAVVGRINKGKSSIVSTLTEDESVRIAKEPRTTRHCERYHLHAGDGRPLFTIVDTPGFEDAPRALAWMREREHSAADRARAVEDFVRHFQARHEFVEECELLEPILAGAGILYVVDASRPYRANYEAEMEILQWTGRPRMALINYIGGEDHVAEWQRALDQYFSIVRVFNAQRATFEDRIALLEAFRVLREDTRPVVDRAIASIREEWESRRRQAAAIVADLLIDELTYRIERKLAEGDDPERHREEWEAHFHDALRERERRERRAVESLYRHERLEREEDEMARPLFARDLFAETTWRVLGLDTTQLVGLGVITGATVGGAVDLAVGGSSFLAGTLIGGVVGGVSSFLARKPVGRVEILGRALGGEVVFVGPLRDPNFAWVLLDRALLHYRLVVGRPHAVRETLVLEHDEGRRGLVGRLPGSTQRKLSRLFAAVQRDPDVVQHALRDELQREVAALLVDHG
jgi:hypothetical protein